MGADQERETIPALPLLDWLKSKGSRQAELARDMGWSDQRLTNWKRRGIPARELHKVAAAMGITSDEYRTRAGLDRPPREPIKSTSVQPGPIVRGDAPLISWVRAGEFSDAVDNYRVGEAEDWLPMRRRAGPNTYCLRVEGDSMTAPHGKTYPAGSIIFVDPDQRSPASGQRVIAKLKGTNEVTFKVFVREGSTVFLRPLNQQYPPMHEPFSVIGTVVGKWEDE